ncbi:hypothetical protein HMPREF1982_04690 [Clostridiales bacterium oral taxon 876 str. F0540]|nr:hypothetical protein HMPREF1982_04690 [Clostridiales bacterium oral taxon 876 str. F0540]
MSAFLGPIHHWLFKKISIHEELEKRLIDIYKNQYGAEIDKIVSNSVNYYGEPLGKKPLEEQIDLTNIHQWLNTTIGKTETRLANILAEVFRIYGDEAFKIALEEYTKQGRECGQKARDNAVVNTLSDIYQAINDYMLEGMPCDRVNFIIENNVDKLVWKTTECLHQNYWKEAGADTDKLYKLRFSWLSAFVSGANQDFEYINKPGDNKDSLFIHEIVKKSSN